MMLRKSLIGAAALATLAIAGCDRMPGAGLGTAVIDLAAIAKATGEEERIQSEATAARERLNAQLAEAATQLEAQLSAEREKLGDAPTEEQLQQQALLQQQAQQQYALMQQQAQQEARQFETDLVLQLRNKIQPLAEDIARSRGADVVFLADVTLFWNDPKADLTDEVVARLLADPSILADEQAAAPAEQPSAETSPAQTDEPAAATP